MSAIDSFRLNARTQKLHVRTFTPVGQPKAVLVWHHVLTKLANNGIAVYAQEAHGHGASEPTDERNRCLVWSFQHLIDDAAAFAYEVLANHPTVPHFVGGQSLGGLITTMVALQDQTKWAGMVLCSAAMNIEWTLQLRLQAPLGNLLAVLVPRARLVPAVKPEDMSQDPAVVSEYVNDPLNFVGPVRSRTANEILKGFKACEQRHAGLTLPILAVHGTRDRCTSLLAVEKLVQEAQSKDKTLHEVPGGYHELLLGPEKETIHALVQEWMLYHANSSAAKM